MPASAQALRPGPSLVGGLLLFGGGLLLESVADWQKFVFKSDPGEGGHEPGWLRDRRTVLMPE